MWLPFVRFVRRMLILFQRERFRRDLAEELSAHQEMKYRAHVEAGLTPQDAEHRTRREMGNLLLAAEQSHDVRTFPFLEQIVQDTWYALRLLRTNFGFSLISILSLALGIGGSTAVFSILNALLIKPLPFGEADRLVRITEFFPRAVLVHLRQQCRAMDIASASPGIEMNVTGQGPAGALWAVLFRPTCSRCSALRYRSGDYSNITRTSQGATVS